jgi:hypothetical protein
LPSEETYKDAALTVSQLIELANVFGFTQAETDALVLVLEQADKYEGLRF